MKNCIYISYLIFLLSCSTFKNQKESHLYGIYSWNSIYGVGATIQINSDNTFIYTWQQGLIYGISKGKWIRKNNILVLNSDKQPIPKKAPVIRENTPIPESHKLKIQVTDELGETISYADCILMKDSVPLHEYYTDVSGFCEFDNTKDANIITIEFIGYRSEQISLNELKTNSIIVELSLDDEDKFYKYFTNSKWIIRNGALKCSKTSNNNWGEEVYKKRKRGK